MFVKITRIFEGMETLIRQPSSAGTYYSKQKNILEREVAVFLESSSPIDVPKRVYGMVVPHDPYIVCGGVAARAYRQIMDIDVEYVVVISSSLHTYFEEISLFKGDAYATPMGNANVDKDLVWKITNQNPRLIASTLGHEVDEYNIEVQLPFLIHVLGNFKLIPVVMGNQDNENIKILSDALSAVFANKKVLIVASSNLSSNHNYERAGIIDKRSISHLENFENDKLNTDFQDGSVEMSAGGAVVTMMNVCKKLGANKSRVLLYRNSGDMGNAKDSVVGYASAIFYS
jgi:AmmeMemoRadiSam system protein B